MKKHLLLAAFGLLLAACDKKDERNEPAAVAAGYDQQFSLQYRQAAKLPHLLQPELTITLADLNYSFCPPNANCFVPDFVAPTLSVTDAQGLTQQMRMPTSFRNPYHHLWIDSASIRANSRRYVLYYTSWKVSKSPTSLWNRNKVAGNVEKPDISVQLRITRPD